MTGSAKRKCVLCDWLCERFCAPDIGRNFWRGVHHWEETYAADWEPWDSDDALRFQAIEAGRLVSTEPEAALMALRQLAGEGSAYAMRWLGTLYGGAHGIPRDDAASEEYFRQALCAGSWMATLSYAGLLYARGAHDKWPSTLGDGVAKGFIPAKFWLGWYRYRLNPTGSTSREVRPLLEDAAEAGHLGAKLILARWSAAGKFGLRKIPRGLRMVGSVMAQARERAASNNS